MSVSNREQSASKIAVGGTVGVFDPASPTAGEVPSHF